MELLQEADPLVAHTTTAESEGVRGMGSLTDADGCKLDDEETMTTSNEMPLKPCPFHVHDKKYPPKIVSLITKDYINGDFSQVEFFVECENCGVRTLSDKKVSNVENTWNTRATPDKVLIDRAELEMVKEIIENVWYSEFSNNETCLEGAQLKEALKILEAAMKGENK